MNEFAEKLLHWAAEHGRSGLPWQSNRNPYSVWISEVMLQQTQVNTVIPYFNRFMATFPNVEVLANASEDTVLGLWSGLGYYRRAKNLHLAARVIRKNHDGKLPDNLQALTALPGIGRSTAGAILALGFNRRGVVLDGNVKRVLARYFAIEGDPNKSSVATTLWNRVEALTPKKDFAKYTQAIMDLGATCCIKIDPHCDLCPVSSECVANRTQTMALYPEAKSRIKIKEKTLDYVLCVDSDGYYLLEKQPPQGLWASLLLPPERLNQETADELIRRVGLKSSEVLSTSKLMDFTYLLTHRKLKIRVEVVRLNVRLTKQSLDSRYYCYHSQANEHTALAQLTRRIIAKAEGQG